MFHTPDHPPTMDPVGLRMRLDELAPELTQEEADQMLAGMRDGGDRAVMMLGHGGAAVMGVGRLQAMMHMRSCAWAGAGHPEPPAAAGDGAVLVEASGAEHGLSGALLLEVLVYDHLLSWASRHLVPAVHAALGESDQPDWDDLLGSLGVDGAGS